MRIFFNNSNFDPTQPDSQQTNFIHSTWNRFSRTGTRLLLSAALIIIGLGTLILLSPIILFFFVAGLFLVAVTFLTIAWKIHRAKKSTPDYHASSSSSSSSSPRIHVESHSFNIDQQ